MKKASQADKAYQAGDYQGVHENPVWRDRANFIIAAYLGQKDGRNEWEQLWARRVSENRFTLCCIPFFAEDLALGDEVETDARHIVTRVVNPSGHYTFRIWFGNSTYPGVKDEVITELERISIEYEWSSENLLGVSAPSEDVAQQIANYLFDRQGKGHLIYETGRTQ